MSKPRPLWPLLTVLLLTALGAFYSYHRPSLESQASRGGTEAQYQLGKLNFYGIGFAQNYPEAFKWFRLAARHGHPKAKTALAVMYARGLGTAANYPAALRLLREASAQQLPEAQNQLGMLYAQGKGVPQDLPQAIQWFTRAAAQGYAPARQNLLLARGATQYDLGNIRTGEGKLYKQARLRMVDLDGITIAFQPAPGSLGLARLSFKSLPPYLQQLYGYNSALNASKTAAAAQLGVVVVQQL